MDVGDAISIPSPRRIDTRKPRITRYMASDLVSFPGTEVSRAQMKAV
jgi:hypothetical protein